MSRLDMLGCRVSTSRLGLVSVGSRAAVWAVIAVVVLGVSACGSSQPFGARPIPSARPSVATSPDFGAFAGYVWFGSVTSVNGTWVVPRVLASSRPGSSATWIGALAPGSSGDAPFIQVGTTSEYSGCPLGDNKPHCPGLRAYFAWWSDTARHFDTDPLALPVRPGDRVSASLSLRREQWTVSIRDARTRKATSFSTAQEANAQFDAAKWLQEDPSSPPAEKPVAYPELSNVVFSGLRVDSSAPARADMLSEWMSENRRVLGPTPLTRDGFGLVLEHPTAAAIHYQTIASAVATALHTFSLPSHTWSDGTPAGVIGRQRSNYASALRTFIEALTRYQWPKLARPAIHALAAADRQELAEVDTAPERSDAAIGAWLTTLARDEKAAAQPGLSLRRKLGLPTG
jgi:Peptidase A4 family